MSLEPPLVLKTCAWCSTAFRPNEAIEHHALGRRLAFDAARGRLWVVCAHCERWNLAPIESRWEAIEECERAWHGTRTRASTGEVGLARLRDGTTLVRIGKPLPLEFAAWRYGDQFGRRRWKALGLGVGVVAGAGALAAGAVAAGTTVIALVPAFQLTLLALQQWGARSGEWDRRVHDPAGGTVRARGSPKIIAADEASGGWGLEVFYTERTDARGRSTDDRWGRAPRSSEIPPSVIGSIRIHGPDAVGALARYAPRLNRAGASTRLVRSAVSIIAEAGGPDTLPRWLAANRARLAAAQVLGDSGELRYLPVPIKLAIEMASHEEIERALLARELATLERQWRTAEEEAAISDQLLLPASVLARLEALRRAVRRGA